MVDRYFLVYKIKDITKIIEFDSEAKALYQYCHFILLTRNVKVVKCDSIGFLQYSDVKNIDFDDIQNDSNVTILI
jgi:hypothetical protein|nr:MAG TPA: hypothetical protein [Caudoviricetes sp.]